MFHIGQEVVCINDKTKIRPGFDYSRFKLPEVHTFLKKNQHYIIRWEGIYDHLYFGPTYAVRLEGINRGGYKRRDTPFNACRFSPVKKETIQVFTEMCDKANINALTIQDEHEKDLNQIFTQALLDATVKLYPTKELRYD